MLRSYSELENCNQDNFHGDLRAGFLVLLTFKTLSLCNMPSQRIWSCWGFPLLEMSRCKHKTVCIHFYYNGLEPLQIYSNCICIFHNLQNSKPPNSRYRKGFMKRAQILLVFLCLILPISWLPKKSLPANKQHKTWRMHAEFKSLKYNHNYEGPWERAHILEKRKANKNDLNKQLDPTAACSASEFEARNRTQ